LGSDLPVLSAYATKTIQRLLLLLVEALLCWPGLLT
jgi:hypothetical protein